MRFRASAPWALVITSALLLALGVGRAGALDGVNPLQFTPQNGWKGFELVTQGDAIGAVSDAGYGATATRGTYDGLGAYVHNGTISIFVNHESPVAAISRVDVPQVAFQQAVRSKIDNGATAFPASMVAGMGYAYNIIYDSTYHAVNQPLPAAVGATAVAAYSDANFSRFCSGTMYPAEAFGPERGFVDQMYVTGEESFAYNGSFYAIEAATRTMWEVPALGAASWENAALVDTGNATHVAMLLNSDFGTAFGDYMRLYVGRKNVDANGDGTIDILERNGLRGGQVYYFDADGVAGQTTLPDGTVSGVWSTSTAEALHDAKFEDIHTNPLNGTQAAFCAQTDGLYLIDLSLAFNGGNFVPASSATVITQLRNDDVEPFLEPDNLVWSANGKIYVQEDGSGNEMFQFNADGSGLALIASAWSEPSGIVDISQLVGYQPGSVFLTSLQGVVTSGAQLAAMISPSAALLPASPDFNFDGAVDGADFLAWQRGVGTASAATASQGDANGDGAVNATDLTIWSSQFGEAGATNVSEPRSWMMAAAAAVVFLPRFIARCYGRRRGDCQT
jgi:hypothetical protein